MRRSRSSTSNASQTKKPKAKGRRRTDGEPVEDRLLRDWILKQARETARLEDIRRAVEAKIINVDRKTRAINLSIKAKDISDEKEAVKAHRKSETDSSTPATIGDLIKAQMDK